jgi:hypothetical protein
MVHTIYQGYTMQMIYDLQSTYPYKGPEALNEISKCAIDVVENIVKQHKGPITMVSAPRTSKGDKYRNEDTILAAILKLRNEGKNVFNQLPIVNSIDFTIRSENNAFTKAHRHDPFKKLFASGFIKSIKYTHNWHTSPGCTWEHGAADEYEIKRIILPKDFLTKEDYSKLEKLLHYHHH